MTEIKKEGSNTRVDNCVCPYCDCVFEGASACNYDMSKMIIFCPKCQKEMMVSLSIEYTCRRLVND